MLDLFYDAVRVFALMIPVGIVLRIAIRMIARALQTKEQTHGG